MLASVNAAFLGEYPDRESAMARIEAELAAYGHGAARLGAVSGGEGEPVREVITETHAVRTPR